LVVGVKDQVEVFAVAGRCDGAADAHTGAYMRAENPCANAETEGDWMAFAQNPIGGASFAGLSYDARFAEFGEGLVVRVVANAVVPINGGIDLRMVGAGDKKAPGQQEFCGNPDQSLMIVIHS